MGDTVGGEGLMGRGRAVIRALGAALVVVAMLLVTAATANATAVEHGFITTRDGTQLRYSLELPSGTGPWPVVMNYEGYAAGADPGDNGVSVFLPRLLAAGYAVIGVQVRGTGCSQGNFDLFESDMGTDGYDAVEWAAKQPWSNGHVGMLGVSFGGITQFAVAGTRPPNLDVIVPSSATPDLYRAVVYPGGFLEYDFPTLWTELQKAEYVTSADDDPDPACAALYAEHEPGNLEKYFIPTLALENPYEDNNWAVRAPDSSYHNIDVPILLFNQWQDEQLPAFMFEYLNDFVHPREVWANFSNGNHGRDYYSPMDEQLELDFLAHYLKGAKNEFPDAVPHLMLDMETAKGSGTSENQPSWRIGLKSIRNFSAKPWPLYLQSNNSLTAAAPTTDTTGDSYTYPLPSADLFNPEPTDLDSGELLWQIPPVKAGAVEYTSGPLSSDAVVAGPSALDLWLSSTTTDPDIQVTVTEVRPDGQEVYVQRGWLAASARMLDPARSSVLRPYPTFVQSDVKPLVPGQPTLLQVPILPFAYAFRKGSRIRVIVDAPTSHTGFWAFTPTLTPATNTVLDSSQYPSRLVLGLLPGQVAHAAMPACNTLRNEPCRANPWTDMISTPLTVPTGMTTATWAPCTPAGCPEASTPATQASTPARQATRLAKR